MGVSDQIAGFILETLETAGGCCEVQRAQLASRFGCVPSQINYVISTRFSPEHGYAVESRRGGNGYIRIRRVRVNPRCVMMHTVNIIGETLDLPTARALLNNLADEEAIPPATARLMYAAVGDAALGRLPRGQRDEVRAAIFKQMLVQSISSHLEA